MMRFDSQQQPAWRTIEVALRLTVVSLLLAGFNLPAATHYVSLGSTNQTPPYTNWATAATSIQEAVSVAVAGDEVVVTNGIYAGGVEVTNSLALTSVSGAQFTVIDGGGTNRCASLTNGASLAGFTLTNGYVNGSNGGGVLGASTNVSLTNCTLLGNSVTNGSGGGVFGGTLYNCTLSGNLVGNGGGGGASHGVLNNCTVSGNSASWGGGAFGGTLNNCTVSSNSAGRGGGTYAGTINNCTLSGNSADDYSGGAFGGTLNNCTVSSNSAVFGGGVAYATLNNCILSGNSAGFEGGGTFYGVLNNCTLSGNSAFDDGGGAHYATLNNCTLSGNWAAFGGGASYSTLHNCIVYYNSARFDLNHSYCTFSYSCTTPMSPNDRGNITNAPLFVDYVRGNLRLQSNSPCINAGNNADVTTATDLDGRPRIGGGIVDMGAYEYRALLVWQASPGPMPPFATWATAAKSIQGAVDAAVTGDEVVVTNGVYAGGVAVTNPLALTSVSGAQFTVIDGGGTNRCVSLANGASLTGFTLTNGYVSGGNGGGVWGASANVSLTNCTLAGNSATGGGGAGGCTLFGCTLNGNSAIRGGGAIGSTLYNCTLRGNSAGYDGGGALYGTLANCTLTGNSAGAGGGAHSSTLYNCIVCFNRAAGGANYDWNSTLSYCCTTPVPTSGIGNIPDDPLVVDYDSGNLRLQSNSPCINAGNNAYVSTTTDLDGNPRIVSGTVDVGAYEYQGTGSRISYAWLQQYGLSTDGSADFADPDHDGMNNWEEWVCGTCPTNAQSALRLIWATPTCTNVTVTWQSVAGVTYFLQRSDTLKSPFTFSATNIIGQAGTTSYADTNAIEAGPFFYRVGVTAP